MHMQYGLNNFAFVYELIHPVAIVFVVIIYTTYNALKWSLIAMYIIKYYKARNF